MKRKVRRITEALVESLTRLQETQAVLLGEEAGIEASDPYFTIDIDVYLSGTLPDLGMRRSLVAGVSAFETSPVSTIDRFLVEELPVSVHYIRTEAVDRMLLRINETDWVFHEPGTNVLYRIERGEVLFSREGWIEEAGLPWHTLRRSSGGRCAFGHSRWRSARSRTSGRRPIDPTTCFSWYPPRGWSAAW